jgi:hypothetical protein
MIDADKSSMNFVFTADSHYYNLLNLAKQFGLLDSILCYTG